jgi:peptidoglycan/LPS O-acetylase OafA/YrhL
VAPCRNPVRVVSSNRSVFVQNGIMATAAPIKNSVKTCEVWRIMMTLGQTASYPTSCNFKMIAIPLHSQPLCVDYHTIVNPYIIYQPMHIFKNLVPQHQERIIGLDILRSIAILIVVYAHGSNLIPKRYHAFYFKFLVIDGVSLFFVLSGFLIGGILLKIITQTNFTKTDVLNFWIRRWFRTIPNYFLVLFGVLACNIYKTRSVGNFNLTYIIFSQNFSSPHPYFFPEAWSLTIEEWFYLLFPLSCYVFHKFLKNKTRSILFSALLFLLFPLILRIIKFEYGIGINDIDGEFRKIMILRLDSIMYGVVAAYILFKQPVFWVKYKYYFLALGIFLLIDPLHFKGYYTPLFFNIESIITFCFLPFLSSFKTTKIKALDGFFIFISVISYSMYLLNLSAVQLVIMPILHKLLRMPNLPIEDVYVQNYCLYWFLTIFCSYFLYRMFENPMTKLRDKIHVSG